MFEQKHILIYDCYKLIDLCDYGLFVVAANCEGGIELGYLLRPIYPQGLALS